MLHERGDPSEWKMEGGGRHERDRGRVGPGAPCGIQPTSSCKLARSHTEDVSGLTLDLRRSLQAVVDVPLECARL